MKYIFLAVTIAFQFLFIFKFDFIDDFPPILWFFIFCLVTGGFIQFSKTVNNLTLLNFGWGLFYGSIISFTQMIIYIVWKLLHLH